MFANANSSRTESRSAVWASRVGWLALLVAVTWVLTIAVRLMWNADPMADDMIRAGEARNGIGRYLHILYMNWSGRWSGVGLVLVLSRIFDFSCTYGFLLTAIQLTVPLAVYALLSAAFGNRLSRWARVVLSLGLVALHWDAHPGLADSYNWLTGAIENHLCLSFGILIVAALVGAVRRPPHWLGVIVLSGAAVVVTGMHELYGAFLCATLVIGAVITHRAGHPGRYAWATVAAAAIVGLVVVVAAPGNSLRLHASAPRHDLARLLALAAHWRSQVIGWIVDPKLLLATLLLVGHPGSAGACPDWLRARRWMFAAAGAALASSVVVSAILINWWTIPYALPTRTVSAIYFMFLLGWFATAFSLGTAVTPMAWASRPLWGAAALCWAFALVGGGNCRSVRRDFASGRVTTFHRAVCERDRLIRTALAAGDRNPCVPPIAYHPVCLSFADIVEDPGRSPVGWINIAYCLYYGLDSIRPAHADRISPAGPLAASRPRGEAP